MNATGFGKCLRLADNRLVSTSFALRKCSRLFSTNKTWLFPRRRTPLPPTVSNEQTEPAFNTRDGNLRRRSRGGTRDVSSQDAELEDRFIPNDFVAEPVVHRPPAEHSSRMHVAEANSDHRASFFQSTPHARAQAPRLDDDEKPSRTVSIQDIDFILDRNQLAVERGEELPPAPPALDPKKLTVFLFPGQGSQFVGMGQNLLPYPNVKQLFDAASDILGWDLLKVCLEGPRNELSRTQISQLAIYVCSVAALERIRVEHPEAVENCYTCAGFSVGEYAALTFAGAIEFEDCLRIIKSRAEAMQQASMRCTSGLLTVKLSHKSNLNLIMEFARRHCVEKLGMFNPVCQIAGYLFADCKLVGGHEEALQFIEKHAADFHIVPLKRVSVSGAFHTHLMWKAQESLRIALDKVHVRRPNIPVISNFTGLVYQHGEQIKKHLVLQLVKPIKWEQAMLFIFKRPEEVPMPHVYEVGPGSQLRTMLKNLGSIKNQRAVEKYHLVDV